MLFSSKQDLYADDQNCALENLGVEVIVIF